MYLKQLQKGKFQKKAKATGDFIGNKIAHKITKYSKLSSQNSSETIETEIENGEFYRKIPNILYIYIYIYIYIYALE